MGQFASLTYPNCIGGDHTSTGKDGKFISSFNLILKFTKMLVYWRSWKISRVVILLCSAQCLASVNIAVYNSMTISTNTMPLVPLNVSSIVAATLLSNMNGCPFVCTLNNSYYMPNFALVTAPAPINGIMTCYSKENGNLRLPL